MLKEFCYDCHGDGAKKGNVAFDELNSDEQLLQPELWFKVLKNTRAGIMPPSKKPQPTAEQKEQIAEWIKSAVFRADPKNPDPGHVTVRRLNRTEYRNTIRDLMGVDFEVDKEFPPDDAGLGFDNIGDALTLSPILLEKYLVAASSIVKKAVPSSSGVPAEHVIKGGEFNGGVPSTRTNKFIGDGIELSFYNRASISNMFSAKHAGSYQLRLDFIAGEFWVDEQFDYNKARLVFRVDGKVLHRQDYAREENRPFRHEFSVNWEPGDHELSVEVEPLTVGEKQTRSLAFRLKSVTVRGPLEKEYWIRPENYARFFGDGPPLEEGARRQFARQLLKNFAEKAFRRPVKDQTLDRLAALAEEIYTQPGKTFEQGVAQAMVGILASPRFLFREEGVELVGEGGSYPLVDEYALASRLSYLFWSSMPDDELLQLAREKKLRANLSMETERLLQDGKFKAFVQNFGGQWFQTRDLDTISIDARRVFAREARPNPELDPKRERLRELVDKTKTGVTAEEKEEMAQIRQALSGHPGVRPRAELNRDLRRALRRETEETFAYIIHEDRSLLELLDSNYTFLNRRLALHYGLTNLNIRGDEFRLVQLPPGSPRGGILTQGSVLIVTSNPTRTSPVKRGKFILENLLGSPPPPPPPVIPPLEDAAKGVKGRTLSLREMLALHREQPVCSSCHNRMDPLGLALENFNALGMWRGMEFGQPIDATGKLLSGETFTTIQELKHLFATNHVRQFYQTVTEKMLTYALGRGLEYYDVVTVDQIVDRLEKAKGRPSALLAGIVESAPFQRTRAVQSQSKH